jgi:dTDP-4-amino-4,6-dideoxygalactose transaminase
VQCEYTGGQPTFFPKRLPNGLAVLAVQQLKKVYRYNVKRQLIAKKYGKTLLGATYLRYPIQVEDPKALFTQAKKQGILLGTWYSYVIDPKQVSMIDVGYEKGCCPQAEYVAKRIINLPTYPMMNTKNVQNVISIVNKQRTKKR